MQNLYIAIAVVLVWVGSLFFAEYVVSSRPVGMGNTKQEKPYGSQRAEAPGANPSPDRNEWRQEQDVQAQSHMAAYAQWSAYISGAGTVLTLVGLWFIKRTLEISQKQLIAAHRPWVSVGAEVISPMTFRNGRVSIKIRFLCENIGGSPAIKHTLFAELFPCGLHAIDNIKAITDFARGMSERDLKINLAISDGIVLLPKAKTEIPMQLSVNEEDMTAFFASDDLCRKHKIITPTVIGCASYVSTIDQSYHQTGFILSLCEVGLYSENGNVAVRFIENAEIPAEGLTLQQIGALSAPVY